MAISEFWTNFRGCVEQLTTVTQTYAEVLATTAPNVHFTLDELAGSVAVNSGSSGVSHNATLFNSPALGQSPIIAAGTSMNFPLASPLKYAKFTSNVFNSASEGTIAFWFTPAWSSGDSGNRGFFGLWQISDILQIEYFTDNNWYIGWVVGGVDNRVIVSSATMPVVAGQDYFMVLDWSVPNAESRVFLNNSQKGSRALSGTIHPGFTTPAFLAGIKQSTGDGVPNIGANSKIDEWSFWKRRISASERQSLYEAGIA